MKIIIPSKGRPQSASQTVELVGPENALVYIQKDQLKSYSKLIDSKIIRTLPDGTYGMGAIRKYMLQDNINEDYVLQLDDDVDGMEYKFDPKVTRIVDKEHILRIIDNCYRMADDLGTNLFGFISSPNPMLYTQLNHFLFGGMVACGIGIIPKNLGDVMFDERFVVNEDHDFAMQTKFYKRFLVMDGRYNWIYGKTWSNEGGCSTLRNRQVLEKCRNLLIQKWGSCIITNKKKPNQIYLHVPF